ncbi:MAG: hypothetical protein JSS49_26375 [Planctomycetes bacterium]|nr:hypothetical protein [Planctomycetota bacterium]
MKFQNSLLKSFTILMALAPVVLASCRSSALQLTRHSPSSVERLEIIYRAHPASGPLFSVSPGNPRTAGSEIVQTAAQVSSDAPSFQNVCWSKTELRIECPHPNGSPDYARVTLHFMPVECGHECERESWGEQLEQRIDSRIERQSTLRERWFYRPPPPLQPGETYSELDLPKSELDRILDELKSHGFFDERGKPHDPESRLEVHRNRHWTARCWSYEPMLDELTTRVYEEGVVKTAEGETESGGVLTRLKSFGRAQ